MYDSMILSRFYYKSSKNQQKMYKINKKVNNKNKKYFKQFSIGHVYFGFTLSPTLSVSIFAFIFFLSISHTHTHPLCLFHSLSQFQFLHMSLFLFCLFDFKSPSNTHTLSLSLSLLWFCARFEVRKQQCVWNGATLLEARIESARLQRKTEDSSTTLI